MKKFLRYPKFLLLHFILVFATFVYFSIIKPIDQIVTYQQDSATVVSCASKTFHNGTLYIPVAQTTNGAVIMGNVFSSNSGCVGQINAKLTALANPKDKNDGVILTLGQFGVLPLKFSIFTAIFLFARHVNQTRELK